MKSFRKEQFQKWYAEQVTHQLDGEDVETVPLEPIKLSMAMMKEIGAKCCYEDLFLSSGAPSGIVL